MHSDCAKFDATAELLHVEGEILLCSFIDAGVREYSRSASNTVEGQVCGCPNPACWETGCPLLNACGVLVTQIILQWCGSHMEAGTSRLTM